VIALLQMFSDPDSESEKRVKIGQYLAKLRQTKQSDASFLGHPVYQCPSVTLKITDSRCLCYQRQRVLVE